MKGLLQQVFYAIGLLFARLTVARICLFEPIKGRIVHAHHDGLGLSIFVKGEETVLTANAAVLHSSPRRRGVVTVMVIQPY